jgi:sulfur-oxidizing protein SoxY
MALTRRRFIGNTAGLVAALVAAGWISPRQALAADWNKAAFDVKTLEELVNLLGGGPAIVSEAVTFDAPDIAENGAVVPIGVASTAPDTESIALLIENNPNVLAAIFTIPQDTLPQLLTRVKMAQTSNVYALVKAGGRQLIAVKEIKVTLGGCGG